MMPGTCNVTKTTNYDHSSQNIPHKNTLQSFLRGIVKSGPEIRTIITETQLNETVLNSESVSSEEINNI